MCKAVVAVEQGGDSIHLAAHTYGVPQSTLHDHVSGKVEYGAKATWGCLPILITVTTYLDIARSLCRNLSKYTTNSYN